MGLALEGLDRPAVRRTVRAPLIPPYRSSSKALAIAAHSVASGPEATGCCARSYQYRALSLSPSFRWRYAWTHAALRPLADIAVRCARSQSPRASCQSASSGAARSAGGFGLARESRNSVRVIATIILALQTAGRFAKLGTR